jgi:multicomponent Na+:H+ antiporter subunit F
MGALLIILALCAFMILYRIFAGPTAADRIISVDILGLLMVAICAFIAHTMKLSFLMDITLTFALLSFVGALSLAKYLEGRTLDD